MLIGEIGLLKVKTKIGAENRPFTGGKGANFKEKETAGVDGSEGGQAINFLSQISNEIALI